MDFTQFKHSLIEGTVLTPVMLKNAGWVQSHLPSTELECWVKFPETTKSQVYVRFDEGGTSNHLAYVGKAEGGVAWVYTDRHLESLCALLLLQYNYIEFESSIDILKMLGA